MGFPLAALFNLSSKAQERGVFDATQPNFLKLSADFVNRMPRRQQGAGFVQIPLALV
jgi:hypothetical protein